MNKEYCAHLYSIISLSLALFAGRKGILLVIPSLTTCSQYEHAATPLLLNSSIWHLLPKPSLDEKPNEDPFLRLIAQELYMGFLSLCNFPLQCVLKVKMLSFLLGGICH